MSTLIAEKLRDPNYRISCSDNFVVKTGKYCYVIN